MKDHILVGVDTGGTFTDFVYMDEGKLKTFKILSTPSNPAEAVCGGLDAISMEKRKTVIHGSTVATNALLERKGAVTALITTGGFEDVIEIGRQQRKELYNLKYKKDAPLITRERRLSLEERVLCDGEVLKSPHNEEIKAVVAEAVEKGAESVAVCFLYSFINPKHEKLVEEECERRGLFVSASHRIIPEFREYERTSTTVVNAYVSPVMKKYISFLKSNLSEDDLLRIMQSNGGSISADTAMDESARTILSGPAGGVVGALDVAKKAGKNKIITFDMGGTSTDVSLVDGDMSIVTESAIAGMPVKVPMIDIHTVGAGGGSIARIDGGGALRVGPESAGADPGPACYGKGNRATVTDANLFLGRLSPDYFLGGKMKLYPERAQRAIGKLSSESGIDPFTLAEGIVEVANAEMEKAVRVISIERGYDLREFSIVSFGGAGGLHAVALAGNLSMKGVIIPYAPGLLSAVGMLKADVVKDYSITVMLKENATSFNDIENRFSPLCQRGGVEMAKEGFKEEKLTFKKYVDMRFEGQSYEIVVPFSDDYVKRFHSLHKRLYGYSHSGVPCEIVNLRLRVSGKRESAPVSGKVKNNEKGISLIGEGEIFYESRKMNAKFYDREKLLPENNLEGPAVIVEYSATTFIPPRWKAGIDDEYNVIIERI